MKFRFILVFFLLFFIFGCSRFTSSLLPSDVKTIHIGAFQNRTFYIKNDRRVFTKDLDFFLTDSIVKSFIKDGRLQVVGADLAQWTLEGRILRYSLSPISYSETDLSRVKEFRALMVVSVTLKDCLSQKSLWSNETFECRGDFFVEGGHMTPERSVLLQICHKMARNILLEVFEGWYR